MVSGPARGFTSGGSYLLTEYLSPKVIPPPAGPVVMVIDRPTDDTAENSDMIYSDIFFNPFQVQFYQA